MNDDETFSCECPSGWLGKICEIKEGECSILKMSSLYNSTVIYDVLINADDDYDGFIVVVVVVVAVLDVVFLLIDKNTSLIVKHHCKY